MGRRAGSALLVLCLLPGAAAAQPGQDCEWVAPTSELVRQTLGASVITRVQNPNLVCRDGIRLRADSARFFETSEFYQLFGNVRYEDADRVLTGDLVRYWRAQGRLESRGNSRLVRKSDGAIITGDDLDYLEAGTGRPRDQLTVEGGRPHAVLYRRPAPRQPGPEEVGPPVPADTAAVPYEIDADEMRIFGDESLIATGRVEVHQDSLDAFADALEYTQDPTAPDRLFLRIDARMVTPEYELVGDSIEALLEGDRIDNLGSFGRAVLTGADIRLAAPRVRLGLVNGGLDWLVAVRERSGVPRELAVGLDSISQREAAERAAQAGAEPEEAADGEVEDSVSVFEMEHPPRAVARAEGFLLVADSIRVEAPGEVLDRLTAVGRARGESTARDSLNTEDTPAVARRDWIEGDTIVASFARTEVPDTAAGAPAGATTDEYELEQLVASLNARSLYRLEAADSAAAAGASSPDSAAAVGEGVDSLVLEPGAPDSLAGPAGVGRRTPPRMALHYVTGSRITITLEAGEVARMHVVGPTQGFHLEPDAAMTRSRGGGSGSGGSGSGGDGDPAPGGGHDRPSTGSSTHSGEGGER